MDTRPSFKPPWRQLFKPACKVKDGDALCTAAPAPSPPAQPRHRPAIIHLRAAADRHARRGPRACVAGRVPACRFVTRARAYPQQQARAFAGTAARADKRPPRPGQHNFLQSFGANLAGRRGLCRNRRPFSAPTFAQPAPRPGRNGGCRRSCGRRAGRSRRSSRPRSVDRLGPFAKKAGDRDGGRPAFHPSKTLRITASSAASAGLCAWAMPPSPGTNPPQSLVRRFCPRRAGTGPGGAQGRPWRLLPMLGRAACHAAPIFSPLPPPCAWPRPPCRARHGGRAFRGLQGTCAGTRGSLRACPRSGTRPSSTRAGSPPSRRP